MNRNKNVVYAIFLLFIASTFMFLLANFTNKKVLTSNNNSTENNINDKTNKIESIKYDISSDKYFTLIDNTFKNATKDNSFLYYDGYITHYPYIQIAIKPKIKINEIDMEEQAKIVGTEVLSQLKKNKYKSGNIFKYSYEYISIYFYNYTDNDQLDRNGGPFMQFEILNVNNLTVEDIVW